MNIFNIFKKKEPPYDESSDCFLAMQYVLKQYEEEYSWLSAHKKILEENNISRENITTNNNNARYTLQYLYKHL